MEIKIIKNKTEWTGGKLPFPQSFVWGEILAKEGRKVERLAVEKGDRTMAWAQVYYNQLPFGLKYAFCPKGPVFGDVQDKKGVYNIFSDYLKEQGCIFWRLEPTKELEDARVRKTININPPATLILDLTKSEEEILKGMHPKTRYNIRLAEKKELEIRTEKNYEVLMKLMAETGKRDNFKLHEANHYKEILFSEISRQVSIYFEGQAIATGVFVGAGDVFTYLYGASSSEHRNLMAPYLVQWEGIKIGKKFGYKQYDFFGVAPKLKKTSGDNYEYDEHHQYAGVTRFKLGFGGQAKSEPGTMDFVLNKKKYFMYQILRFVRRLI